MAISVDTSRPLRRPLELAGLVEAVENALPSDESSWIEWKSQLDLTAPVGAFKVARAILSFANRMPDAAARYCGGTAYFILGAEPGNIPGTVEIDPADLDQALVKYLGSDGPLWSPHYVKHGETTVLVIVVESPAWGDPIHTLRKTFGNSEDGVVYVRSQARSKPANTEEMKMLMKRLVRGADGAGELTGLEISCTVGEPGAVLVVDPSPEMVDAWIGQRRQALVAWQERRIEAYMEERRRAQDKKTQTVADALGLSAAVGSAFKFSPTVNSEEIEKHLEACRTRLLDLQRRRVFAAKWSMVTVSVLNPTSRVIDDVELTLFVDGQWSAVPAGCHDYEDELEEFPPLPSLRNHPLSVAGLRETAGGIPDIMASIRPGRIPYVNPNIDVDATSITLQLGQLRPEKRRDATAFTLVLHGAAGSTDSLAVTWSATSTTGHGVQRGVLQIPVRTEQLVLLEPDYLIPVGEDSQ